MTPRDLAASRHCRVAASLAEIARAFGLSSSGMAQAAARMEEKLARNAPATRRYQAVKEAILSTGKTSS